MGFYRYRCAMVALWRLVLAAFIASCVGATAYVGWMAQPPQGFFDTVVTLTSFASGLLAAYVIGTFPGIWGKWPKRP